MHSVAHARVAWRTAQLTHSSLFCIAPPQGKQAARDEQGVLACLKRALKIANAAQQQVCVGAAGGGLVGCSSWR